MIDENIDESNVEAYKICMDTLMEVNSNG